jgi:hypothetical protein
MSYGRGGDIRVDQEKQMEEAQFFFSLIFSRAYT